MACETIVNRYEENDVYCWIDNDGYYQLRFFMGMQAVSDLVKAHGIKNEILEFKEKSKLLAQLESLESQGFRVSDLKSKLEDEQ